LPGHQGVRGREMWQSPVRKLYYITESSRCQTGGHLVSDLRPALEQASLRPREGEVQEWAQVGHRGEADLVEPSHGLGPFGPRT
jgi:hypothetical protein